MHQYNIYDIWYVCHITNNIMHCYVIFVVKNRKRTAHWEKGTLKKKWQHSEIDFRLLASRTVRE